MVWSKEGDDQHLQASGQVYKSRVLVIKTCGVSGDHLTFQFLQVVDEEGTCCSGTKATPVFQKRYKLLFKSA